MHLIYVFSVIIIWINKSFDAERWHNRQRISYYADLSQSVNRTQAEVACTARGGRLALLKDGGTHQFVYDILPRKNSHYEKYFIGLQAGSQDCGCGSGVSDADCTACRQSWSWDDGTWITAERWQLGMPIVRENRNCGTENSYMEYSAVTCFSSRGFICQHSCSPEDCHRTDCSFNPPGVYSCQCDPGHTGQHCDTDINECASYPCMNEATCNNLIDAFSCNCSAGYTGERCETDINECTSEPCQNDGQCIDGVNRYECVCPDFYTGVDCETEIIECDSNPCQHGGICIDLIHMYICSCGEQYYGNNCENDVNINSVIKKNKTTENKENNSIETVTGLSVALVLIAVIAIITSALMVVFWKRLRILNKYLSTDAITTPTNEITKMNRIAEDNKQLSVERGDTYETASSVSDDYQNAYQVLSL